MLRQDGQPCPVAADLELAGNDIGVDGSITIPASFQRIDDIDLTVSTAGPDRATLALVGVSLPRTPPHSLEDRLTRTEQSWRLGAAAA